MAKSLLDIVSAPGSQVQSSQRVVLQKVINKFANLTKGKLVVLL